MQITIPNLAGEQKKYFGMNLCINRARHIIKHKKCLDESYASTLNYHIAFCTLPSHDMSKRI